MTRRTAGVPITLTTDTVDIATTGTTTGATGMMTDTMTDATVTTIALITATGATATVLRAIRAGRIPAPMTIETDIIQEIALQDSM